MRIVTLFFCQLIQVPQGVDKATIMIQGNFPELF